MPNLPLSINSSPCDARPLFASPRLFGWLLLLLAVLASGVYANSLFNGFAYDDVAIVKDNPHVTGLEWSSIWKDNYWQKSDGIQPDALYRPMTLWSYLANQYFTPGQAWAFHLVNVILHALVTVLVALLAWRIVGNQLVALLAALLFAVHPLHTEAVANTVGRAELLAALWAMLTLLIYLPSNPLMQEDRPTCRSIWHGWLVALCFFAAILCKETPAVLLPALVFIDLWRWCRWSHENRPPFLRWCISQTFRYYVPLAAFFAIYLALRINACGLMTDTGAIHPIVNLLVKANPAQRIVTPFELLARYLHLTFWPVHLSADYSAPSIRPTANPLASLPLTGILACALAVIISLRTWRKAPQILLVTGLFFCSYMLVSNVIRIGTIFGERLFYWPSAFVLILVAWGAVVAVRAILQAQPARVRAGIAVASSAIVVASVAAMSYRTYVRNTDWEDNIPLAIATGRDNPGSAKACFWAGNILVWADRKEYEQIGKDLIDRAIELCPDFAQAEWELAKFYGRKNQLAQSLLHMTRAIRFEPGMHMTYAATSGILLDLQRTPPESVMPVLEDALAKSPEDPTVHLALAMAYHGQKKFDLAQAEAQKALDFGHGSQADGRDQYHEAAAELARIIFDSGDTLTGIGLYKQYVMRLSKSVDARCCLAELLMKLDSTRFPFALEEAQYNLDRARDLEPTNRHMFELTSALRQQKRDARDRATASALPHALPAPEAPPREAP